MVWDEKKWNWFRNYSSNRYEFASINNSTSSFLRIVYGFPYGSNLGTFLFLLCINDLPSVSTNLEFLLYEMKMCEF